MGNRRAGTCYIKCDGNQLEVDSGVEAPLSDVVRETKMASGKPVGFKETGQKPYVKGTFAIKSRKDYETIVKATALTVTAEFANGDVYTLSDAWIEGETAYNADEGTAEIEFCGLRGSWA